MNVKLFSMEDITKDAVFTVLLNPQDIYLLPRELPEFAHTVEKLTEMINDGCHVRFAYEMIYPLDITLGFNNNYSSVCSLSDTLEKINEPIEQIFLIVPDEIDAQFIEELSKQLYLLQIPFEINKKSYQKFMVEPEKFSSKFNTIQNICQKYNFVDPELNSLIKTNFANTAKKLESLMQPIVPKLILVGDFQFDFNVTDCKVPLDRQNGFSPNIISKYTGFIFIIDGSNDELSQLINCSNLLFSNLERRIRN